MFNIFKTEESFLESSYRERKTTIETLLHQATIKNGFYMMLAIAVVIVTTGILGNSLPIVIGGMLLAPLLIPVLLLSLSLVATHGKGTIRSLQILLFSSLISIVLSYGLSMVIPHTELLSLNVSLPWWVIIIIALVSGIAGAFSYAKTSLSSYGAGVAIAIALLPPLCNAGIGLEIADAGRFLAGTFMFLMNVAGIVVGASIVFYLLGYGSTETLQEKVVESVTNN
jgi:uncharacterized hydrophobic protein (TIGR00271 family)